MARPGRRSQPAGALRGRAPFAAPRHAARVGVARAAHDRIPMSGTVDCVKQLVGSPSVSRSAGPWRPRRRGLRARTAGRSWNRVFPISSASPVERAEPRLRIRSMRVRNVDTWLFNAPGASSGVFDSWQHELPRPRSFLVPGVPELARCRELRVRGGLGAVGCGVEVAGGNDRPALAGAGEELGRLRLLGCSEVLGLEVGCHEPERLAHQRRVDAGPATVEGQLPDR